MNAIKVAILGATSHIAKGLISCWAQSPDHELFLYARSPERVNEFLQHIPARNATVFTCSEFGNRHYDAVVNCVGFGSSGKLQANLGDLFRVTAFFDDLIIDYLTDHPQTCYLNMSSGAVYGSEFRQPVDDASVATFPVNNLTAKDCYGIVKLSAESRHRAAREFNIVDLRVFGYFSRFIDLDDTFLLSELLSCVISGKEFVTGPDNILRDFVLPSDLVRLIEACLAQGGINDCFDVYSAKPVYKDELIEFFTRSYGLRCRVEQGVSVASVTGVKSNYASLSRKAAEIGYRPRFSSFDGIVRESQAVLDGYGLKRF